MLPPDLLVTRAFGCPQNKPLLTNTLSDQWKTVDGNEQGNKENMLLDKLDGGNTTCPLTIAMLWWEF